MRFAPWLMMLALPAFAGAPPDDNDDNGGPGLDNVGDVLDAKDVLDHVTGHPNPTAAEAQGEKLVVHGGMSWDEMAQTHQRARALGSSVSFTEPVGHAPNPFQVEPSLRGLQAGEGQLGREAVLLGEAGSGFRGAQWVEGAGAARGGVQLAEGSYGAGRVALNVAEEASLARGTFTVARVAEEGLMLKVGVGALGLGGLAASRRRRRD